MNVCPTITSRQSSWLSLASQSVRLARYPGGAIDELARRYQERRQLAASRHQWRPVQSGKTETHTTMPSPIPIARDSAAMIGATGLRPIRVSESLRLDIGPHRCCRVWCARNAGPQHATTCHRNRCDARGGHARPSDRMCWRVIRADSSAIAAAFMPLWTRLMVLHPKRGHRLGFGGHCLPTSIARDAAAEL